MINIIDNRRANTISFCYAEPGSIFEINKFKGIFVKSSALPDKAYPIGTAFDEHGEPIHFLDLEPHALVTVLNVNIIITNGE